MSPPEPTEIRPIVVGANHRSSTMALRDRLFVEDKDSPAFLARLRAAGVERALVLSTCDRVEVVAAHPEPEIAAAAVRGVMADHARLAIADLGGQLYEISGDEAVRHVFTVASSLDSQVIGEAEVMSQVKTSHRLSQAAGMCAGELESILQAAYAAAKRIRAETAIGERPVSIAAVAVRVARDLHGELDRIGALLVGGGDMGQLIARDMLAGGLGRLVVTHPAEARAESLALALDCHHDAFADLGRLVAGADVVISSLGQRRRVLTRELVEVALGARRNRPILFLDVGVPGDVEPGVDALDAAFRYDLGDLERVAMEGRASREAEAAGAWRILEEELAAFLGDRAARMAVPALTWLRDQFDGVRAGALADSGGDADKATRLLVSRLLHGPSQAMRAAAGSAGWDELERALRRLFAEPGAGNEGNGP